MVEYRIDRRSGVATYVQIVQQTKQALRLGLLEPGDKLPTAREVVEATAINPNTVLKAYRELEREGLVEARRGLGTFVRKSLGSAPADSPLRAELDAWAVRAREAGLERDDVAAHFTSVLDEQFTKDRQDEQDRQDRQDGRNRHDQRDRRDQKDQGDDV
ncbi:GntR family transcriptional regulator [Streptomyces stelliscabiei]|uniref:GntR family transcriptional regulator n=1 Tax=Streptomyces stelliscabiei TaxID=146820 RepID=A0A8I0P2M3_9ACTN|nr:GntR family transcriptional regulator [Streptomyces stelliscabiei]MBE1598303.1 GntR family transcriptional regulator [Streptomyces stelliscabiei]SOD76431.1 GntR family transcriptional regulator [Streptomyces sp. 1222.2]